jgi:choline dehydrogenase-like flavoprotein
MSQGPLPQQWAETQTVNPGLWGEALIREMEHYNHQAGLKIVGEVLPRESNRVTLADEKDEYGLPIPWVTFGLCDNHKKLVEHAVQHMTEVMRAAGGRGIWSEEKEIAHLNGTARMGDDARTSVVNADCRSWDIHNLWICDGSVFPAVGEVNPSLTIQAIACRAADRIRELASRGEL